MKLVFIMDRDFKFTNGVVTLPIIFVIILWFVYWMQVRFNFDFVENGIYPRTFSGLQGVFFSPFIHTDLKHLYNNSIPLLVLLSSLQFFYAKHSGQVIFFGVLLSGLITWIIGRENYHIGASGLIYALVSFIFFKGVQTKYYRLVALSFAVIVVYGGMMWYMFPEVDDTISWEGHLGGFIAGFALSIILKTKDYVKLSKYEWQRPDYDATVDKFMQRFDENGNFVNLPVEADLINNESYFSSNYPVEYNVVNEKKEADD